MADTTAQNGVDLEHPYTLTSKNSYAEALALTERLLGKEHPDTVSHSFDLDMSNLAACHSLRFKEVAAQLKTDSCNFLLVSTCCICVGRNNSRAAYAVVFSM